MESVKNMESTPVPYIVYEGEAMRAERRHKRLIVVLIIAIAMLFASNLAWLHAWMSYDYVSTETVIEATDGMANFHSDNNHNGDNYYGEDIAESAGAEEEK